MMGQLGAVFWGEFSQINSRLGHARMYVTANARAVSQAAGEQLAERSASESTVRAGPSRHSDLDQSWGAMPVVVVTGDELQFPCIPQAACLLAPVVGTTDEQKAAAKLFGSFDLVYKLRTAKRFEEDPLFKGILEGMLDTMKRKGGFKPSLAERAALEDTNIDDGYLKNIEGWYESALGWSIVTFATVTLCHLSARHHETLLFVVQAEDAFTSAIDAGHVRDPIRNKSIMKSITREVLQHPHVNSTGRLPGFCAFHVGMRVRFVQAIETGLVCADQPGVVVGVDVIICNRWCRCAISLARCMSGSFAMTTTSSGYVSWTTTLAVCARPPAPTNTAPTTRRIETSRHRPGGAIYEPPGMEFGVGNSRRHFDQSEAGEVVFRMFRPKHGARPSRRRVQTGPRLPPAFPAEIGCGPALVGCACGFAFALGLSFGFAFGFGILDFAFELAFGIGFELCD